MQARALLLKHAPSVARYNNVIHYAGGDANRAGRDANLVEHHGDLSLREPRLAGLGELNNFKLLGISESILAAARLGMALSL